MSETTFTISDISSEFSRERIRYRKAINEKYNDPVLDEMIDRLFFQIEYFEKFGNNSKKIEKIRFDSKSYPISTESIPDESKSVARPDLSVTFSRERIFVERIFEDQKTDDNND